MPAGGHSSFFPVPAAHGTTEAADGIMIAVFPFKEAFCYIGNGMSHESWTWFQAAELGVESFSEFWSHRLLLRAGIDSLLRRFREDIDIKTFQETFEAFAFWKPTFWNLCGRAVDKVVLNQPMRFSMELENRGVQTLSNLHVTSPFQLVNFSGSTWTWYLLNLEIDSLEHP